MDIGTPRLASAVLSKNRFWWVALAWTLVWFALLNAHALFNPDEGRYAEIPREMLASGDWLVPRLNDLVYIEKPPLQYWGTATVFAAFGVSEWSARLYTGLCGLLTVLITAALAYRLWGRAAGWRAGLMSGSTLLMVLMGHHITLDMSLTFFTTLMLAAFCVAQQDRTLPSRNRLWMLVMWAAMGCAVMTKGFVAVLLPGATLVIYSVLQRDFRIWKHLRLLEGLPVLALISAPWMVLIQARVPQFFQFFVVREHFARYLTRVSDRYEPWWFFIPVLIAGVLPWAIPGLRALLFFPKARAARGAFDARRLLWVWAVVTFCFFSASDSKLVPYILPMFPALVLLMASADLERAKTDLRYTAIALIASGATLAAIAAAAQWVPDHFRNSQLLVALAPYLLPMGLLLVIGGFISHRYRQSVLGATAGISITAYVFIAALLCAAGTVTPFFSGAPLAIPLVRDLSRHVPVYSVQTYDQSLTFYLKRTVTMVDERNELDFGLTLDPSRYIATLAEFESKWLAADQAIAVLEPETLAELRGHALPMVVQAQTSRRVIVTRR